MSNEIDEGDAGANETIIIISTDPLKRNRIVHHLHCVGYSVLEAAGGAEALDLARDFERVIDVVFVDDRSSDINAHALSAVIKRMRPAARILLWSQLDDQWQANGLQNRGVAATILIQALQQALRNHEA